VDLIFTSQASNCVAYTKSTSPYRPFNPKPFAHSRGIH